MRPFIDIHCHCLAGLDDGPGDLSEALKLCKSLVEDRIDTVIATPHTLGRFDGMYDTDTVRRSVLELNEALQKEDIPLKVLPGSEVRLDERIFTLLKDDKIITLADKKKHLLLELFDDFFIDITPLLVRLNELGVQCIIAHPERLPILVKRPDVIERWLSLGASLQVTAASLLGKGFMGPFIKEDAWSLLESGFVSIIASDAHDTESRSSMISDAWDQIHNRLGQQTADMLCIENPRRISEGKDVRKFSQEIKTGYDK